MPTIIPRDKEWTAIAMRAEDMILKRGISYATFAREVSGKKDTITYGRLWRNVREATVPAKKDRVRITDWLTKWERFMENAPQ